MELSMSRVVNQKKWCRNKWVRNNKDARYTGIKNYRGIQSNGIIYRGLAKYRGIPSGGTDYPRDAMLAGY